ncbi:MAG: glycosyltransferase 87 family protein [Planctomycetota bacterium]
MGSPLALFVAAAGIALAGFGWLAMIARGPAEEVPIAGILPFLPLLAIPALSVWAILPRLEPRRATYLGILVVGVVLRALFLPSAPCLSDDVNRYLWDGRVQAAGHLPYGVAPRSADLDGVEESWPAEEAVRDRINHPEIPTIYPPFLEEVFALVAWLGWGLRGWRWLLLVCDLGIAALIIRVLQARNRDPRSVVLYLWHPLPLVETMWSAHADAVAVLLFLWGLTLLAEGRSLRAALLLGVGGAAKLLPLGLLPALWRRAGPLAVVVALLGGAWCALPYLGADPRAALAGLGAYAERWYFNDLLFRPLGALLGIDAADRTLAETQMLRRALAGMWLLACLWAARKGLDPFQAGLWVVGSFVLLTPTLQPWYLLWGLPLAVLSESRGWLLLTVTVWLAYLTRVAWQEHGVWVEPGGMRWLVFTAPLGFLAVDLLRVRRDRRRAARAARESALEGE